MVEDNNINNTTDSNSVTDRSSVLGRASWDQTVRKPPHPMEQLLRNVGTGGFIKEGDIVEGVVLLKKGGSLFVDLDSAGIGIVYGKEYMLAHDAIKNAKPGDDIHGKVIAVDNEEGYVELSLQEAGREKLWLDAKKMMKEGRAVRVTVKKANTGGLILMYNGLEGFLPASQLSFQHYPRVEGGQKEKILQELQKFIGTEINVKILDVNPSENKLIFTEKGVETEEIKQALAAYNVGDVVSGVVAGMVDFGAFVRFNDIGLEGLVHLSEFDWTPVTNPRDVLKKGDQVNVKIIDIQADKVSLSLKQLKEDPWKQATAAFQKGSIVEGKVVKMNPYGAFIELGSHVHGLVHVSSFGSGEKMCEQLVPGQTYPFTIAQISQEGHRIALEPVENIHAENTPTQEPIEMQESDQQPIVSPRT